MTKKLKTVSVILFLLGSSIGTVYAVANPAITDVRETQQSGSCTGVVQDPKGEPVIGASVVVKGTTNGTITDLDGRFQLSNVKQGEILQVSFIGYTTEEVRWNGKALIIQLKEDAQTLEEVVVTAYGGRQLRSKVTNSIAKVDNSTISSGLHSNPAQALSGAVAGLRVSQTSGDPGSTPTLVLRGGTSLDGSGSPLVIIDGAQRSMSDVNPADIESMEVMKDAGATAIYGARAANGVVLITTKRGKAGFSAININAKIGVNYFNSQYDFLNARDYLYWMRTAYQRSSQIWKDSAGEWKGTTNLSSLTGAQPYGTGNIYFNADGTPADGNKVNNANWSTMLYNEKLAFLLKEGWETMDDPVTGQKLIFKNFHLQDVNIDGAALSQDYTVDLSGGNEKGAYYSSLGYNYSHGNAVGNWYKRFTWTFNGDYKIRPWLTSNSSFNYSHNNWYGVVSNISAKDYIKDPNAVVGNYFSRAFSVPPTFRGYNPAGEYLVGVRGNNDGNVHIWKDALHRDNNTDKFTMTQAFNIQILNQLSLKLSGSWYYQDTKYESFNRDYMTGVNRYFTNRDSSDEYERELNQTYNAILNYNGTFKKNHSIHAMAGVEYYAQEIKGFSAAGYGAATDNYQDLNLTKQDGRKIDSWHFQDRILSFFGKLDYDYQGKYLVSAVLRNDGYSRLTKDNRWGLFPGISAGWVFSKEAFMEKYSDVISFAKLRTSYGSNGNLDTRYIKYYTVHGAYATTTNYKQNTAILMTDLPNTSLRWEKSYTFEVGMDMSFFANKYNLNIVYYNRRTKDKLASITVPSHSGVNTFLSNNGEIQNQGIELEFNAKLLNTKDWKWNLGLNMAHNKNKIISLPYNGKIRNMQDAYEVYTGKGDERIWVGGYQEGQSPGDIYAFKAEGIYNSIDEIPGNIIDKSSGNNGANNKILYGPAAWNALTDAQKNAALPILPGDVRWKDVNGDNVIDDYDKVKIGSTLPKLTGGIHSQVSWKDLTLNARFDYAIGHKIIDSRTPWIMGNMQGTFNTISNVFDTWTETNHNAKYPSYVWADQLGKRNYARETSMFIHNASYLAIRELNLSYSLPKVWISKLKMEKMQVSVSGQNLGYITGSGAKNLGSPEQNASGWGTYPLPTTVIFGLNISF
ncbi:SusC/RagA family TonB-linked outer membrane protein [Bacteroides pyogenes]|uniref:SusC/RagA family TonB-linked outer membrane protein n=1 Tax=Bacteroides pyogenes TaxID=310300 RepID=UPI003B42F454